MPKTIEVLTPEDIVGITESVIKLTQRVAVLESLVKPTPPTLPLESTYKLKLDVNFNNGIPTDKVYMQTTNTDANNQVKNRASVVTLPWDTSKKGLKTEIFAGDRWNGSAPYPRSEALISNSVAAVEYNKEYLFRTTFSLDGNTNVSNEMLTVFQIHHLGPGTIPVAVYQKEGKLQMAVRQNINSAKWMTLISNIEPNRKYSLDIYLKGNKESRGYVKVMINGVVVAEHVGQVGYLDQEIVGEVKFGGLYNYFNVTPGYFQLITDGLRWFEK